MDNFIFIILLINPCEINSLRQDGEDQSQEMMDHVQEGTNQNNTEQVKIRVDRILKNNPVFDGHNDFPSVLTNHFNLSRLRENLNSDLILEKDFKRNNKSQTDLNRLREGCVGGQVWSAYVPCSAQFNDAVEVGLTQIDTVHRLIEEYPKDLMLVTSTKSIKEAFNLGKIASMVGVEGGHAINSNLAVLRSFYRSGVRYLTLTHQCNTPWIDSSDVELGIFLPEVYGLSEFGEHVILEMNRIGMMIDLSHVDTAAMRHVLRTTQAPVMFSHSGARAVFDHPRNVPDDVLELVRDNDGIVMVVFNSCYLVSRCTDNRGTIKDVVRHIDHVRRTAGVDHVGLGAGFDGVDLVPVGLEDVSKYPNLLQALIQYSEHHWADEDLMKLARKNFLRVFQSVEIVRDRMLFKGETADNVEIQDS